MHVSDSAGFGWEADAWVAMPLALSLGLYATGLMRLWARAGAGRGVTFWQAGAFAAGWLVLFAALVSPLHEYAEHLFSAHMAEHELLMAVAAPLLALSRPLGVFLSALPGPWRHALASTAHLQTIALVWSTILLPLNATILHGIAIWTWHIPVLLDGTLVSENLHRLQHISFLGTALIFWWAIVRLPRREFGVGALHVFATMVHTGLLGALLTLAPHVLYPRQTADASLFGLSPLQDQQLAGLIMWVPGGALYLLAGLTFAALWLGSTRGMALQPVRDKISSLA